MKEKQIKDIAKSCGIEFYTDVSHEDYFEGSIDQLQKFVEKIIDTYEDDDSFDSIAEKNANERYGFTSYGKKEDWE